MAKCEFCKVPLEGTDIEFDGKHFCSENCSLFYENGYLFKKVEELEGELRWVNNELLELKKGAGNAQAQ